MIFTSPEFLFLFFPFVVVIYYLLSNFVKSTIAKWFLAFASLSFYGIGSPDYFLIFLLSVLLNYFIGSSLLRYRNNRHRHWLLVFGIVSNLWLLGYYKYFNFLILNTNLLLQSSIPFLDLILPIGISFYTFQLIAYLIDSYRGQMNNYNFLDYLLFISFFPQLIVGPIVHHSEMIHQFEDERNWKLNYENISKGIFLFFLGATKKILLADPLTQASQNGFDHLSTLSSIDSWFSAYGYTISYYFDLSGYADMAIGLGLVFNINIPQNFDSPYRAQNFADYWRRWHMTLSKFLGDYIFRSFYTKGDSSFRFYMAILLTFFVSGLWHGAGFNFIVWGMMNGILVCFSHYLIRSEIRIPPILGWSVTFFFVILLRVFFVSSDIESSLIFIHKMFDFSSPSSLELDFFQGNELIILFLGSVISFFFPNSSEIMKKYKYDWKFLMLNLIFIIVVVSRIGISSKFLYFQF